jgi:4-hydroxy-3-methylbut-2-enyl diphosphate reductase
MGVRRAVEGCESALEKNSLSGRKVFTLGPLIHNPLFLSSLEKRGVKILNEKCLCGAEKNSLVVIRAHGAKKEVLAELEKIGVEIVDSTCPRVHLSQKNAAEWSAKGFFVIIAGDRNHGEVTGVSSYCGKNFAVIENAPDAEKIPLAEKCILISQTTFSPAEFEKIASVLKNRKSDIKIFNSICPATLERQNALKDLQGKVDGILVIGGKNSANTRRLFETALTICKKSFLVESWHEIPGEIFALEKIGITAGASTPDFVIDETEEILRRGKK